MRTAPRCVPSREVGFGRRAAGGRRTKRSGRLFFAPAQWWKSHGANARQKVLIGLMGLYTLGNLACAFAPTYELLMVARILSALVQASFFGLGAVVATQLVPAEKQASAIAAMFLGATLANVLGAPGGTILGQAFGWRSTFFACAGLGVLAALALKMLVPVVHTEKPRNIGQEFASLLRPKVLRALTVTVLGFAGYRWVSPLLLLFGLGMVFGNPIGGRLTDKDLGKGLRTTLAFLAVVLVLLGLFADIPLVTVVLIFFFGAAMFATIPPLQVQAMQAAGDEAPLLGSAFNIAAFNLANAAGAWFGGYALDAGLELQFLPYLAAAIAVFGLVFVMLARTGRQAVPAE
ncbi:Inner membrane transport protein YdhP [Nymphon striatum]|nr:Inner membrane transport protein YdhP [Nymphon striatum]